MLHFAPQPHGITHTVLSRHDGTCSSQSFRLSALIWDSWIYFTWPLRKQAAYKQATRGPTAVSPFQGTRQ